MMPKRKKVKSKNTHPTADAKDVKIKDLSGMIAEMGQKAEEAKSDRANWALWQDRWCKKRYGVRPKTKTFPWAGASNLHIPLTDKIIRKVKPPYINQVWGQSPIANFEPIATDPAGYGAASKIEESAQWAFDDMVRSQTDFAATLVVLTDRHLQKGVGICKTIWDYKESRPKTTVSMSQVPAEILSVIGDLTDEALVAALAETFGMNIDDADDSKSLMSAIRQIRESEEPDPARVTFDLRIPVVEYNAPRPMSLEPEFVLFPWDTPTDLNRAEWICDQSIRMTENELREHAQDGRMDPGVVEDVIEKGAKQPVSEEVVQVTQRQREGLSPTGGHLFEIHEYYFYHDVDGDGVGERCVMTVSPNVPDAPLRGPIELPYEHGQWPFVLIPFELNEDRALAPRGIPQIVDDMQTEITNQHNAGIDSQTRSNAPLITYQPGTINPANDRYIPGQWIPSAVPNPVTVVEFPEHKMSHDIEERNLKVWAEEYVGSPDFGITGQSGRQSDPRTKYEIQSIQAVQSSVFSLSARLFSEGISKIFHQMWSLYLQYGPDTILMPNPEVPRESAMESAMMIPRDALKRQYRIIPNGRGGIKDPVTEQQKAMAMLEMFKGDPYVDQYELHRWFFSTQNELMGRRLLKPPGQAEKEMQAAAAQEAAQQATGKEGTPAGSSAAAQFVGPEAPPASAVQEFMAGGA